ncbi:AraC family transcriptional regulator [Jannaschia formosa]|uniref:AraC family transcriptional regulator n=1 Tax=Jannaschia formosa TaxID=2259592 RepID=UPI000E1BB2B5|nr:helix-turn-helix domain-containing protein [Jannaschia formosa]TFL16559.1 AraC family transcriptional regulator [Jannaschia formosa]
MMGALAKRISMATKVTRDGRIVLWEGASLWTFDVLPQGEQRVNRMHTHHAFQLTLSAGGIANIRTPDSLIEGPVILIGPDVPHAIEPEGRIALLFVEPESRAGARLRHLLGGVPIARLAPDPRFEQVLARVWDAPAPLGADVAGIGQEILQHILGHEEAEAALDPRILRVLHWMEGRDGESAALAEAARIACLSPSRFSHLFVEQVGLPFRTFLLWRRLMRAVAQVSRGDSLTAAAHQAGFADSAHFSRTFHRMFGLPAAALELARSDA